MNSPGELKRYAVKVACIHPRNIAQPAGGAVTVFALNTTAARYAAIQKMKERYLVHQNLRTQWVTVGDPEEA